LPPSSRQVRLYKRLAYFFLNTGVVKSKFTVVRMEKDMQVMIITIAKIDKS
jgi:hypothetical protein